MIVNGNANAKTGKKKTQRCKGARTQGKKKAGKKETQRRKDARAQGKQGSQNLEQLFSTLPSYLHPTCILPAILTAILTAILIAILSHPPTSFLLCVLAPLHLCVSFFSSLRSRLDTKKNQPTRGLGESADGCFLEEASERRVD
jgi:Flp pilus assembly protein TadB